MTLDAATVQIAGCFDSGMAYVAPSRVRDIEHLRFRRPCETLTCEGCERCRCDLTLNEVKVRQEVLHFFELLDGLQAAVQKLADAVGDQTLMLLGPRTLMHRAAERRSDARRNVAALAEAVCRCGQRLDPGTCDDRVADDDGGGEAQGASSGGLRAWLVEDSAEDENGRAAVIIAKNLIVLSRVSYRPCLPSRIGSPDKDFQKAYTEPVLRDGYYLGDQGSCSSKG